MIMSERNIDSELTVEEAENRLAKLIGAVIEEESEDNGNAELLLDRNKCEKIGEKIIKGLANGYKNKDLRAASELMRWLVTTRAWVMIYDKEPKVRQHCLLYVEEYYQHVRLGSLAGYRYQTPMWIVEGEMKEDNVTVTKWMPLPTPEF